MTLASLIFGLTFAWAPIQARAAQPNREAVAAFDAYVSKVEARIGQQRRSPGASVAPVNGSEQDADGRTPVIEQLTPPSSEVGGAMLHHWRGTVFVPGARGGDLDRLLKDVAGYPSVFAPQVLRSSVLQRNGDHYRTSMRVRQKHVLTVVMDSQYEVDFAGDGAGNGFSNSKSLKVSEIESPGTAGERALSGDQEHGFLWRQNTYWTYKERDGGLWIQIESVSLSRSVPRGLGWIVGPFVESVPRESLEFTLHSVSGALSQRRADLNVRQTIRDGSDREAK